MTVEGTPLTASEASANSAIGVLDRPANPAETTSRGGVSFEVADAIVIFRAVDDLPEETLDRAETLAVAEAQIDLATFHAQRRRPRVYTPETAAAAILSPPAPPRHRDSMMTATAAWAPAPPANESGQLRLIGAKAIADVKERAQQLVEASETVAGCWEKAQTTVVAFSPAQRKLVVHALERRAAAGDPAAGLALEHLLHTLLLPAIGPSAQAEAPELSVSNQRAVAVARWLANLHPQLRPVRLAGLAMMLVHR